MEQESLDLSPGTWQQVLDSFYGKDKFESPESILGTGIGTTTQTHYHGSPERRPGLVPESIDKDAYREFMRGL
jgi:hypothetical protein